MYTHVQLLVLSEEVSLCLSVKELYMIFGNRTEKQIARITVGGQYRSERIERIKKESGGSHIMESIHTSFDKCNQVYLTIVDCSPDESSVLAAISVIEDCIDRVVKADLFTKGEELEEYSTQTLKVRSGREDKSFKSRGGNSFKLTFIDNSRAGHDFTQIIDSRVICSTFFYMI